MNANHIVLDVPSARQVCRALAAPQRGSTVSLSRRTLRTGAQVALGAATLVAAGCGGPIDSVRLPAPTPSASASAAPTPLSLSLTNLSFSGTAQAQTVGVTEPGYT